MAENTQNVEKDTITVLLDQMPASTHEKIKRYQGQLIKRQGRFVTVREAYYEMLNKATKNIQL